MALTSFLSPLTLQTYQQDIQRELNHLLNSLLYLFPGNELAYLSLQGKNELQIRDRVAWFLQQQLDIRYGAGQLIVRREWAPPGFNGKKVDLAVLVTSNNNNAEQPIALMEFKAHSFVNNEDWPYLAFMNDICKMYAMSQKANIPQVDMYYIYLHSTQTNPGGYQEAVAYWGILNNPNTITYPSITPNDFTKRWGPFFSSSPLVLPFLGNKTISVTQNDTKKYPDIGNYRFISYQNQPLCPFPHLQSVGNYLGYDWYVAPMVWGPFKRDISITPVNPNTVYLK